MLMAPLYSANIVGIGNVRIPRFQSRQSNHKLIHAPSKRGLKKTTVSAEDELRDERTHLTHCTGRLNLENAPMRSLLELELDTPKQQIGMTTQEPKTLL